MKKRILTLTLVLMLVVGMFAACATDKPAAPSDTGDSETVKNDNAETPVASANEDAEIPLETTAAPIKIEVVSKGFQVDFWKMVNQGCTQAGEDLGAEVNFVGPASEANIAEQIEQLNNAFNKKPDAIAFAPLDQEASMDVISQIGNAGVPLVTFDANIELEHNGAVLAFVATDNVAAGKTAADKMYEQLKEKIDGADGVVRIGVVRIGVVAQDTTSKSVAQRTKGFIDHMVELCGAETTSVEGHDMYANKIENAKVIIDVGIPAETTDAAGVNTAQTIMNKKDLLGIYGSNEFSAKAIINANQSLNVLGNDKIIAIGFDSGALQMQAIRDGVFLGSITQDPVKIGYTVVEVSVKAVKGEKVSDVSVPYHFYDVTNIDDPEIASCLYQ